MTIFTGIAVAIIPNMELLAVCNFIFFVDKKSLEFKVVNKDSKQDRYNLKEMLHLRHVDDDNEVLK